MKKDAAIKRAKEYLSQADDISHGGAHVESMLKFARQIASHNPETNIDLLEIACWWHDVGRLYPGDNHESISAKMARDELKKIGFSADLAEQAYLAIAYHDMSDEPTTLEGKILKDADKLDYLPIWRWEDCIRRKTMMGINATLRNIPNLRNHKLHFEISKEMFDKLFANWREFIKNDSSEFLAHYKDDLLNIKVNK
jgi:hypothetical protein